MARYPGAAWKPLGSQTEPRMSRHSILCFHTMVGSLRGTDSYFRGQGFYGVESHFGVGHATDGDLDGAVWQWQDTDFCADANLDGKPEVVSIETSDGGNPDRPWSPKQIDSLVELGVWVCKTHNIPPRLINGNQPGSTGIAYHRQGCDHSSSYRPRGWPYDQWRVPNGVRWSSALGKTCPGDVRIKQLVDVVIPRIKAGVEGDDMPLSDDDKKWITGAIERGAKQAATEVMNRDGVPTPYGNPDNPNYKLKYGIAGAWDHAYRAQKASEQAVRQLATLAGQIAALEEAHRQQTAGEPVDYDRVTAAAEAGARAAIESSVLDVDITVNNKGDAA